MSPGEAPSMHAWSVVLQGGEALGYVWMADADDDVGHPRTMTRLTMPRTTMRRTLASLT
jgi:hypothetical protein